MVGAVFIGLRGSDSKILQSDLDYPNRAIKQDKLNGAKNKSTTSYSLLLKKLDSQRNVFGEAL